MDKKTVKKFSKEMKLNNYKMSLNEMYSVYLRRSEDGIQRKFQRLSYFENLEEDVKEMYLKNFKKLFPQAIDTKLFSLDFRGDETKITLSNALRKNLSENAEILLDKLCEEYRYETDVIVTFLKGKYYSSQQSEEDEEDEEENLDCFNYVLMSVNKVETPPKSLSFDTSEKEFKASSSLDFIINLNPLEGVMYPSLEGSNKVMYYIGKPKELNKERVENILDVNFKSTATDEKAAFIKILTESIDDNVKIETLDSIYKQMEECKQDEQIDLNKKDLKYILKNSGINVGDYDDRVVDIDEEKFNIDNIMPNNKVTINCGEFTITLPKKQLEKVVQGKNKITLEIDGEIFVDGIPINLKK